ncbi:glycosyltransferase [Algoriphagus sp. C2-6-M1]|uniref:glycosyltransferase n=1 Tax=Algoriphagus persicinus TaxID=3108754 RepID=UPI002B3CE3AE|nr:glycosyltransferase [Algoriphagus sp. C2-6-M1]MEB2782625.1 glycosyltransferase [Algoriphagus sp. C2-6-M1]
MHILIFGVPLYEGMAGSVRVRNLIQPISKKIGGNISNLYFSLQAENCEVPKSNKDLEINLNFKSVNSIFYYLKSSIYFITNRFSRNEENIFYLYETPDLKTIFPLIYAKIIGYKIVVDIVEDNSLAASFGGSINRIRIKSGSFILKNLQFLIDLNLVISTHLKNLVISANNDLSRVLYIPVTMDIGKYPINPQPTKIANRIFYGGSFGKKDGLESLIIAFERVCGSYPDLKLVLTGKGENKADFEHIMDLIQNSVFTNRIEYKGFLSSAEYHDMLNSCDIFCVIRDNSDAANSGFPSKLAEFLATGKAVIVSSVGDVPSFLKDKVNALLIQPGSIEDLVSALRFLIDDPSKIDQIGKLGREVAFKSFNNLIESEKLYKKLLTL